MDALFVYFLLTVLIINLSPGPAMMFVLQQSQSKGVRTGMMAALGIEFGVFIYVVLTALGIGALFSRFPTVYAGIQLVGAAYLLYLAYISWPRGGESAAMADDSGGSAFLKGVLINLTNPKIVLFFLSLIPQFVPANSGIETFILYGVIFNVGGVVVNVSAALMGGYAATLMKNNRWFDYVPPILFIAIALYSIGERLVWS